MSMIASRELRNSTRSVLERVRSGERVTITVDGLPVAELRPVSQRRRWVTRDELMAVLPRIQADAALAEELRDLAPDRTGDLPW